MQKDKTSRTDNEKEILVNILSRISIFEESKRTNPLFQEMSNKDFYSNLSDCLKYEYYDPGEALFHAGFLFFDSGELGDKMYVVLNGKAGLFFKKDYKACEQEAKLRAELKKEKREGQTELVLSLADFETIVKEIEFKRSNSKDWMNQIFEDINSRILHVEELLLLNIGRQSEYLTRGTIGFAKKGDIGQKGFFGERSLINSAPRMGTILATKPLHLLVMNKREFDYFFSGRGLDEKKKYEFFSSLFQLQADCLQKIQYEFSALTCRMNHLLFREQTPVDFVYLLKEGQVEVAGF